MSRPKGPRGLKPEETELWEKIARRTKPLKPTARRPVAVKPKPLEPPLPERVPAIGAFTIGQTAKPEQPRADLQPSVAARLSSAPVAMDHKAHRKLQRGKLRPEARIDLHGMTLADAHPALIRFISESHADERRLVLVITGKGKDRDQGGPIPVRPGILRHQVPQWLSAPPLRSMILQVSQAHVRHGGEGALYVYLRRRR